MENDHKLDKYDLTERLRVTARKLEGIRGDHFIDTPNLCVTCKHATIIRQASKNHRRINCSVVGKNMPEDIVECSDHASVTSLSLSQMTEIALLLNNKAEIQSGYL